MKAIIVGGGIGGLATAVALDQRGWQVEVLERAPAFTEAGAGLSLWPNALRALDRLGLGDTVRGRAVLTGQAGIRDAAGRWLSRSDTAELERRFGPTALVHRADLLADLRAAVPGESLRSGITVRAVRPDGTVRHSGGESRADLVVGADGLRSVVRSSVWPDAPAPRYVGYTSWRLITPPVPVGESCESWGRGERFGYARLPDGRVYCYAAANAPEGEAGDGLAGLRRRFGGWHDPIPALLAAADPARGAAPRPVRAAAAGGLRLGAGGPGRRRRARDDPRSRPGGLPGARGRRGAGPDPGQWPAAWTPTTGSAGHAARWSRTARTRSARRPSGPHRWPSGCATPGCACCPARRWPARSPRSWTGPPEVTGR